jgi:hypothetical protein
VEHKSFFCSIRIKLERHKTEAALGYRLPQKFGKPSHAYKQKLFDSGFGGLPVLFVSNGQREMQRILLFYQTNP